MPVIGQSEFTEVAVASAATCNIGATDEWRVGITGSVAITSLGTAANKIRFIRFAGALVLTYNATTLILPGAASITTAAGDKAIATSDASGNWTVHSFTRANGKPVIGPAAADITDSTSAGRALLTAANAAAQLAALGLGDAMIFKGVIDCSANPNYPAADRGDTYKVSVAGKIGGGSGPNVEVGDTLICNTDSTASGTHASVGSSWGIIQGNIDGAVVGPASVTDDLPAIFDGPTGRLVKSKTYAAFKTLLALVKGDVGLGSVDNTADTGKPVSTAQQTALDLKLNISDLAAQSDQETGTSNVKWVSPGRQHHHDSAAKAWGFATVSAGVPTLQDSFNIAGITDTAVGRLTWTIGTDFSSANYSISVHSDAGAAHSYIERRATSQAAGSFEQRHLEDVVFADPANWHCHCFGDQ
jgi:hypothetical protein